MSLPVTEPNLNSAGPASFARHAIAAVALAILVVCALMPTLTWLEFSNGSENLNVATTLEMRRTNRWLLPTLNGEPRIAKPPLTAWITASAVPSQVVRDMSSLDPSVRESAARSLALRVRGSSLLAGCLMLLAVFELGRRIDGPLLGLVSMLVCASCAQFLRETLASTTDIHLALWVTVANASLAGAILGRRCWMLLPAAAAIGLAFMSKGPVAIIQTVVPAAFYVLWNRLAQREPASQPAPPRRWAAPLSLAAILFTLIALPWFVYVYQRAPEVAARWFSEVTREGATNLEPSKWYNYVSLFALMMPWTIFMVGGLWLAMEVMLPQRLNLSGRPANRELVFALFLLLAPILIMCFFRDRKERYLLPMTGPAAILAARAFLETCRHCAKPHLADKLATGAHWVLLIAIAIGLPAAGLFFLKTIDGRPWYSIPLAASFAAAMLAMLILGMRLAPRRPMAILACTVILLLAAQAMVRHGYGNAREGRSDMKPMADLIWRHAPAAEIYFIHSEKKLSPGDLAIYLNRPCAWADPSLPLPPSPAPRAAVIRERRGQLQGSIPPGATFIDKIPRDRDFWHLYLVR